MEDHKWDFAFGEALKEIESEYDKKNKKSNKEKKNKHSKPMGFLRRFSKKKGQNKNENGNEEKRNETEEEEKEGGKKGLENQNNNKMAQEQNSNSPIIQLKECCSSPIMNGTNVNNKPSPRKQGVAERNETERQVVYRTLKNYNQINKLHDYDLV